MTKVRVDTDGGSRVSDLVPGGGTSTVGVAAGKTRRLRFTLAATEDAPHDGFGAAGISEITVPGLDPQRSIRLPDDHPAFLARGVPTATFLFERSRGPSRVSLSDDEDQRIDRLIDTPSDARFAYSGTADPVPGTALNGLLYPGGGILVSTSSTLSASPAVAAERLLDGSDVTSWSASPDDPDPRIDLLWRDERIVDQVQITIPAGASFRPRTVIVAAGGTAINVNLTDAGVASFTPIRTNSLSLSFPERDGRLPWIPASSSDATDPLTVAAVRVPALADLTPAPRSLSSVVRLPCGGGPPIIIDGDEVPTRVDTTLGALLELGQAAVTACVPIHLTHGPHHVVASPTALFVPRTGALVGESSTGAAEIAKEVNPVEWGPDRRVVDVRPGPASFLVVRENFNRGWTATTQFGRHLRPVRLDGWQQGWSLPADVTGRVVLRYEPQRWLSAALRVGLGALALLSLLVIVPVRRRRPIGRLVNVAGLGPTVGGIGAVALLAISGWYALVALVMLPLRRWRALSLLAGGAYLAAGLLVARSSPARVTDGDGAFGLPAQVLTVIALAAVTVSALGGRSGPSGDDEDGSESRDVLCQPVEPPHAPRDIVVGGPHDIDNIEPVMLQESDQGALGEQAQVADDELAGPTEDPLVANLAEDGLTSEHQEDPIEPCGEVRGRDQQRPI